MCKKQFLLSENILFLSSCNPHIAVLEKYSTLQIVISTIQTRRQTSTPNLTFCGIYFIDIQDRVCQSATMNNQLLIKTASMKQRISRRLLSLGVLLILLGFLSGLLIPILANPRMGLSSHIEGVMSGMLLILMGIIWPRLSLGDRAMKVTSLLLIYGAYANWANPLLAAAWAAGGSMMPMASMGLKGTPVQEMVIGILSISLALALLIGNSHVLWGLRGEDH
jgi:(hydroxyamino)benzene mutase